MCFVNTAKERNFEASNILEHYLVSTGKYLSVLRWTGNAIILRDTYA